MKKESKQTFSYDFELPRDWDYDTRFIKTFETVFHGKNLSIRQSPKGPRVGSTVWDVAIVMCKFFEERFPVSYFQNKRIIELGSGVGLLGIAIASLGVPIILTEQQCMMEILQQNVKRNITANSFKVKAIELFWGSNVSQVQPPFHLILASDVTYEKECIPSLVKTLSDLSSEQTEIYLGFEIRKMDAEELFFEYLEKYNFGYEKMEGLNDLDPAFQNFPCHILKIQKKKLQ